MSGLSILYRGPLASCNYDCDYCPFAKHRSSREELAEDERALRRFVEWVRDARRRVSLLFTPWGEALIRPYYQRALTELSHFDHVDRVAIQTNLTFRQAWLDGADLRRIALWTTFHPTETSLEAYVDKCRALKRRGVRFSVGIVGMREHAALAEELRRALPSNVYMWVNAYKSSGPGYYTKEDEEAFTQLDAFFPMNNLRHESLGHACRTGESVISVDGEGDIRRCHFVKEVIGNLYTTDLAQVLRERPCPNQTCGCHIGYVHLDRLALGRRFGDGLLERVPQLPIYNDSVPMTPPRQGSTHE